MIAATPTLSASHVALGLYRTKGKFARRTYANNKALSARVMAVARSRPVLTTVSATWVMRTLILTAEAAAKAT